MQIQESFREQISYLDLDAIEKSDDTIYIIDNDFRLKAFNQAWINFAKNNSGELVLTKYPLASSIIDAFSADAKSFYKGVYARLMDSYERFDHDYECSSDEVYRVFHQTAYPLHNKCGLMITNHLIFEGPHQTPESNYSDDHLYKNYITQCAHCRKVQDHSKPNKWDWIPSLVRNQVPNISHTFCPACLDFYYPDLEK